MGASNSFSRRSFSRLIAFAPVGFPLLRHLLKCNGTTARVVSGNHLSEHADRLVGRFFFEFVGKTINEGASRWVSDCRILFICARVTSRQR
jgi:hypothetical protein